MKTIGSRSLATWAVIIVRNLNINGLTVVLMPPTDLELLGYNSSQVDTILAKLLEVPSCTRGDSGGMKL